jgi:hypothetical protein
MGPVSERGRDELLVRDHDVHAVIGLERRRAYAEFAQRPSPAVFELDVIADGEAAVHQDNNARDKIGRNLLQPGAEPDTERTAEDRQRRQIGPHHVQQQQKNHHEDGDFEHLCRHFAGPRVERLL